MKLVRQVQSPPREEWPSEGGAILVLVGMLVLIALLAAVGL